MYSIVLFLWVTVSLAKDNEEVDYVILVRKGFLNIEEYFLHKQCLL